MRPSTGNMYGKFEKPHEDCNEIVGRLVGRLIPLIVSAVQHARDTY